MSEPAFERVEEVFNAAAALPPERRDSFLDAACAGDDALRGAVERLLFFDEAPTQFDHFLVSPVGETAERLRRDAPRSGGAGRPAAVTRSPNVPGYEILETLGRGGMGVVYKARQVSLDRLVALKMLLAGSLASPAERDRFRNEAVILARLHLPNIVPVYEVGEADGRPYFTMEFIDGPSLFHLLHGHPEDVTSSARVTEELARTIYAVHQCGIIHRDLKPGNILFAGPVPGTEGPADDATWPPTSSLPSTPPKITDFGVAKDWSADRALTQSGSLIGTPCYMAPEQATHGIGPVGPGADIYALGSILYELLVGRTPFDAGTPVETIAQLLHDEPLSPLQLRPTLPRDLATICLKCLEKSPSRRYATALALADDLRRFRDGEPIHARPVGPVERWLRWAGRRPLVAGLVGLIAVLVPAFVVTTTVLNRKLSAALARADARTEVQRRQIVQLNVNIGLVQFEAGDQFAAVLHFTRALEMDEGSGDRETEHRVRIARALRHAPRLVNVTECDRRILWVSPTPSGPRAVVAGDGGAVEVWDPVSARRVGVRVKLRELPVAGAVSPNGRWLTAVGPAGAVSVASLRTGAVQELATHEPGARVAFPADGAALVVQQSNGAVRVWELIGSAAVPRPWPEGAAPSGVLSDDARWLVAPAPDGTWHLWDVGARLKSASLAPGSGLKPAAVSSDGCRVAFTSPEHEFRVWDVAAGRWVGSPMASGQTALRVVFSPDGDTIATLGGESDVRLWRAPAGKLVAQLPWRGGVVGAIEFSPDGRRLLVGDGAGARAWECSTGRPVTPRLRHAGPLAGLGWDAGGLQFVTVSRTGRARLWELTGDAPDDNAAPDPRPVDNLVALAEVLSCGRIDETQSIREFDAAEWHAAWVRFARIRGE